MVPDERSAQKILQARMNYNDYLFLKTIGRGAFGEVQLVCTLFWTVLLTHL